MNGIVLALFGAIAYSSAAILVSKGLSNSSAFNAAFVNASIGNMILWPLAILLTDFNSLRLEALLLFALAGLLAPGVARLLYYRGMESVGVSVNASILAIYPLYTSIFAVIVLNEDFYLKNWAGIICIILGAAFTERRLDNLKGGHNKVLRKDLSFPFLASLTIASSYIIRKYGLSITNEPLLGVTIGYTFSFLLYSSMLGISRDMKRSLCAERDFRLFWKAGICLCLGWILAFYALSFERVSIVTSLLQTQPLFVCFLAYVFLKEPEHFSPNLLLGAIFVVLGVVLVMLR